MLTQLGNKSLAGKILSNAVRSMLKIFKDTIFLNSDRDLRSIIPLYHFFELIEDEFDQSASIVFHRAAEDSLFNIDRCS